MIKNQPHKGTGHRKRLRERFLNSGLEGFHDYEVIELLLTLGTPRKDCKDIAKAALAKFKTLQGVFEAPSEVLQEINGIGPTNLFGIKLIKEVADRYFKKKIINEDVISNPKALKDYLFLNLSEKYRECFNVIFLDAKNKAISIDCISKGTLSTASVYPREIVKIALNKNAAALIFAHNHPSGDPKPSEEDIMITKQLVFACKAVRIIVHEHIIIGRNNQYFSFSEFGYITQFNHEYDNQNKLVCPNKKGLRTLEK
jgi:DNA repair protein RadC